MGHTKMTLSPSVPSPESIICDVWKDNLESEFARIRELAKEYSFIALDTEFPGVVATPMGIFRSKEEFHYSQVAYNVDVLKVIQIGFSLMNSKGESPPDGGVWQFNFHFSIKDDIYSTESIQLLQAAGIDFVKHFVSLSFFAVSSLSFPERRDPND